MAKTVSFPVIDLKSTGGNIESCRREAGLSVRELQDYFGFEYPQAIYKWQHGECLPTVDNLLALSRILEVRMEDLLVYEDQEVSFFLHGYSVAHFCHQSRISRSAGMSSRALVSRMIRPFSAVAPRGAKGRQQSAGRTGSRRCHS